MLNTSWMAKVIYEKVPTRARCIKTTAKWHQEDTQVEDLMACHQGDGIKNVTMLVNINSKRSRGHQKHNWSTNAAYWLGLIVN